MFENISLQLLAVLVLAGAQLYSSYYNFWFAEKAGYDQIGYTERPSRVFLFVYAWDELCSLMLSLLFCCSRKMQPRIVCSERLEECDGSFLDRGEVGENLRACNAVTLLSRRSPVARAKIAICT